MPTHADTQAASAAATSIEEALESGFLPDDPHYRKTGRFSDDKETVRKEEASAASEEVEHQQDEQHSAETEEASAASAKEENADTAAASAAAETQNAEKKGPAQMKSAQTSAQRWKQRERELRELREKVARLEGRAEGSATRSDSQQASQPATESKATATPRPKIDDVDAKTGKPKFALYADYEAAKDEWLQNEAIRKFQETSSQTDRQRELANAERVLKEGFTRKLDGARKKYADFDNVALNPHLVIPKGSVVDGYLLDSDNAGELLYHLGQHPEILEGFYGDHDPKTGKFVNRITPFAQARKLFELEQQLAGKASSSSSSSAKPITQAGRPPNQVSTKGTVAKDAVEQAVEEQDFESYAREQNSRDRRLQSVRKRT